MTAATEVAVTCPACARDVNTQGGSYAYARGYLCAAHVQLWDAADEREHARGKGCPHLPRGCGRCADRALEVRQ
jgi:hypothetical protein